MIINQNIRICTISNLSEKHLLPRRSRRPSGRYSGHDNAAGNFRNLTAYPRSDAWAAGSLTDIYSPIPTPPKSRRTRRRAGPDSRGYRDIQSGRDLSRRAWHNSSSGHHTSREPQRYSLDPPPIDNQVSSATRSTARSSIRPGRILDS